MPDLTNKGVSNFWKAYEDPMIYRVVTFLEGVEDWVLDGQPDVEAALKTMQDELENLDKFDINNLGQEDAIVTICNAIKSGRGLRLLQYIDTVHPGAASRLLGHAEETTQARDDKEGLFLQRNIVFERLRLLGRIFSEARFYLVLQALEGEESD